MAPAEGRNVGFWILAGGTVMVLATWFTRQRNEVAVAISREPASRAFERNFIQPLVDTATAQATAPTPDDGANPSAPEATAADDVPISRGPGVHMGGGAVAEARGAVTGVVEWPAGTLEQVDPTFTPAPGVPRAPAS